MQYIHRYEDRTEQYAYENACDCHRFGESSKGWNDCGILEERRKEIWAVAWYDTGDGIEERGRKPIGEIIGEVYGR